MDFEFDYNWPRSKAEALAIQEEMACKIELHTNCEAPSLIAAVDTAYGFGGETVYASAVVTAFPEIDEVERAFYFSPAQFPYIPGLFFFREGPAVVGALAKLKSEPDLLIVHGHGIAHPRTCGMACCVGLAFGRPTIGCARKLLVGAHRPVPPSKGSSQPLLFKSKEVGTVYRSKDGVKPIYISPGYRCSLEDAREVIVKNLRGFRLPEPLRLAHLFANKYKRHHERKDERRAHPEKTTAQTR